MKKNNALRFLVATIIAGVFFVSVLQTPTNALSYHEIVLNGVRDVVKEIYDGTGTDAQYFDGRENGTVVFATAVYEAYQNEDYQAILNYIQDNGVQFYKPENKEAIQRQNAMIDSLSSLTPTPFASNEATVKMYYPRSEVIAFPKNEFGNPISFKGDFYTFARFNYVTKKVVWGDRPYTDFAEDVVWPGAMSNAGGGGTKSYSGSNYIISNSWLNIRCKWSDGPVVSDYGPIYYTDQTKVYFTAYTYWDGGGVINRAPTNANE